LHKPGREAPGLHPYPYRSLTRPGWLPPPTSVASDRCYRSCQRPPQPTAPATAAHDRLTDREAATTRDLRGAQLGGVGLEVVEPAAHEKRLFRVRVELSLADLLERLHGVLDRHKRALEAGEHRRGVRVLRQETLDPPGAANGDLVFLGELVHAK